VYFNVNFNVDFKLIKVHLLVSELYILFLSIKQTDTSIVRANIRVRKLWKNYML